VLIRGSMIIVGFLRKQAVPSDRCRPFCRKRWDVPCNHPHATRRHCSDRTQHL